MSGDDSVYISEDDVFAESADEEDGSDNSKNSKIGYGCDVQNDNYDHDNDIDSDDTYEYSEIAQERKYGYHADSQNSSEDDCYHSYENSEINDSEYVGGQNILRSLSNVTSLGLLTDAGEVYLPPSFADRSLFQYAYIGFLHISQVRLQIISLMLAKETFCSFHQNIECSLSRFRTFCSLVASKNLFIEAQLTLQKKKNQVKNSSTLFHHKMDWMNQLEM